jgi:N-methylhydantoinase A
VRSSVQGILPKVSSIQIEKGNEIPDANALTGSRPVHFGVAGGYVECPTYARNALKAGNRLAGPALIEEHASTTVVFPSDSVTVDGFGNLIITIGAR